MNELITALQVASRKAEVARQFINAPRPTGKEIEDAAELLKSSSDLLKATQVYLKNGVYVAMVPPNELEGSTLFGSDGQPLQEAITHPLDGMDPETQLAEFEGMLETARDIFKGRGHLEMGWHVVAESWMERFSHDRLIAWDQLMACIKDEASDFTLPVIPRQRQPLGLHGFETQAGLPPLTEEEMNRFSLQSDSTLSLWFESLLDEAKGLYLSVEDRTDEEWEAQAKIWNVLLFAGEDRVPQDDPDVLWPLINHLRARNTDLPLPSLCKGCPADEPTVLRGWQLRQGATLCGQCQGKQEKPADKKTVKAERHAARSIASIVEA